MPVLEKLDRLVSRLARLARSDVETGTVSMLHTIADQPQDGARKMVFADMLEEEGKHHIARAIRSTQDLMAGRQVRKTSQLAPDAMSRRRMIESPTGEYHHYLSSNPTNRLMLKIRNAPYGQSAPWKNELASIEILGESSDSNTYTPLAEYHTTDMDHVAGLLGEFEHRWHDYHADPDGRRKNLAAAADRYNHLSSKYGSGALELEMETVNKKPQEPERMARRRERRPRLNVKWRYAHEDYIPTPIAYGTPPATQQSLDLRRGGSPVRFSSGETGDRGNDRIRADARDYVAKYGDIFGIAPMQPVVRRKLNEDFSKRSADAFDAMTHDPQNPRVKEAYDQLQRELIAQYDHMAGRGNVKVSPWMKENQPYRGSGDMMNDVRNLRHLWIYPTVSPNQENSFGATGGDLDPEFNPLVRRTGHDMEGYSATSNDLLRALHDFYGQAREGYEFGPQGEYNAYHSHAQMFSPLALKALAVETHLQNSFFNSGKHLRRHDGSLPKKGDVDYIHPASRPFADQKVGEINPEIMKELSSHSAGEGTPERMSRLLASLEAFHAL